MMHGQKNIQYIMQSRIKIKTDSDLRNWYCSVMYNNTRFMSRKPSTRNCL